MEHRAHSAGVCSEPDFPGPCDKCGSHGPRCVCWVVVALCPTCCGAEDANYAAAIQATVTTPNERSTTQ